LLASSNGNVEIVQLLLASSANVNVTDLKSWCALTYAVHGQHFRVIDALLGAGANPNVSDRFGFTSLMQCCSLPPEKVKSSSMILNAAEHLLNAGADVNCVNGLTGTTPMHEAAKRGNDELAVPLINAGARCNVLDNDFATPLFLAANRGHLAFVDALADVVGDDCMHFRSLQSPVHAAAERGHVHVLDLLLLRGANVVHMGNVPLQRAARNGCKRTVALLALHPQVLAAVEQSPSVVGILQRCQNAYRQHASLLCLCHAALANKQLTPLPSIVVDHCKRRRQQLVQNFTDSPLSDDDLQLIWKWKGRIVGK
jgi:ankyrin repeat protein